MSETKPRAAAFDDTYVKWTVAAIVFFAVLEVAYFVLAGIPSFSDPSRDYTGHAIGRDFLTTWLGGRSAFTGGPAAWFDFPVYNAALAAIMGPDFPQHFWSYPPHFVLFIWPFGLLPYLPAYFAWCALGIALYVVASAQFVRREHLLFAAAAPGVAVCVFFGQNGFYVAALLLGGLALLQRRQVAAGVLFGILTVKPQLGILLPLMLLLTGRWLAIASAAVTFGALVAITGYLFGPEVWTGFFEKIIPQQTMLLEKAGGLLYVQVSSAFFGARLLRLPLEIAWVLQIVVSAFAVAAVTWTYWRKRDPMLSTALFIVATFLVTPYALNYDMVIFGCVAAMLRQRADNEAIDHWLGLGLWGLPVTMMLLGAVWIPLAPLLLLAFAGRLLWRMRQAEQAPQRIGQEAPISA